MRVMGTGRLVGDLPQEAVCRAAGVNISSNDVSTGVDPESAGCDRAWVVDRGSRALAQQEAMELAGGVAEHPHHHSLGIDVPGRSEIAAGHIERYEVAILNHIAV